ncbi:hypothetical protein AVEN_22272-1 [Araneus ventricosus]|uniref:Uncharacterized protein n=1 Tax=Araneus ventricosus TaxID=182803 RepID=A0A4Y2HUU0_ARAVE|nr:hypothetical protein AVEN_22272-1 [Araneus ventricosus]
MRELLDVKGLFWYPAVGWGSLFPHVNNWKSDVSCPNRGYQNRPLPYVGREPKRLPAGGTEFGDGGCQLRCRPRHLTAGSKSLQNSPRCFKAGR